MTYSPSEFRLYHKEYPMFSLWATQKGIFLLPKELAEDEEAYSLESKVYVLMKRLNQDYRVIMDMDSEERDKYFEMELELIKKEAEDNNNKND